MGPQHGPPNWQDRCYHSAVAIRQQEQESMMRSMCVATPVLMALALGLPAVASASERGADPGGQLGHVGTALQLERPAPVSLAHLLDPAAAQQQKGAVRRPPSSGGGSATGSSGGASGGRSGGAVTRGGGSTTSGGSARSGGTTTKGSAAGRGNVRQPTRGSGRVSGNDRAVARGSVERPPRPRRPIYIYQPDPWYYDRWGYGGFGLGYFYYSPWSWYGPSYYQGGGWGRADGAVKLKVKPRDAEVLVDGYYAGTVDDFDGAFQELKLDPGSYRIEVRKPGYESLAFDVRVQRDRTITFRGELKEEP
jgi:hypothetical protein